MPELFYLFHSFTNWFTTALLILMFVDCFFLNRSQRGSKWWWFFVLMWGNWVGALIYFFLGPSFFLQKALPFIKKQMSSIEDRYREKHRQPKPTMPAPYDPPYTAYQQGYQPQQSSEAPAQVVPFSEEDQYEQPQATYPDLPPQQQQQYQQRP